MIFSLEQFKQMTINDLERAKFCQDANGNIAIRRVQGISARGNPVETLADLPPTGTIEGEAIVVRGDPVAGSTIMIWNGTTWVQLGAFDYNKCGIDATDTPDYLGNKLVAGDGVDLVESDQTPGYKIITFNLNAGELQAIIEAFTTLDLSDVQITLGEIGGDIVFTAGTTIDRTNTTSTGTQNFDADYIANYIGSIINIEDSTINSTNNEYNNDGDTVNNENVTTNNNGGTTNNTNTTTNNVGTTNNYDESSVNNFEGDMYIGGNIIQTINEDNNGGAVIQSGTGQAFTDINNVLLCDLAYATATPIDPTAKDSIKLIVGGSIVGNDLGQGITGGNPAIYGNASNLRGNVLTPAIVNSISFGVAFKFGDSKTIEVSDFGFTIPTGNTILGVKVEVIFNSNTDTVNVDCITMIVYSTAGDQIETGIEIQEAGVVKGIAKKLNFKTGAVVTDMGNEVIDVDISGGTSNDIYNNYLILTDNMAGTPPEVDIADTRIVVDTPYLVFFETQPVGNITKTLTNGNLHIASDDNADILDVKVLFRNIGPARQYMKGNATLTGAGPRTVTDPRITITTPAMIMPRTTPVGYVTATTGAGVMTISSTGVEIGVIVDYIVTLDTTNYSDAMPYNPILGDDDMLFRKSAVSGVDEAVKWSDVVDKIKVDIEPFTGIIIGGNTYTVWSGSSPSTTSAEGDVIFGEREIQRGGTYSINISANVNAQTKIYKNNVYIDAVATGSKTVDVPLTIGDILKVTTYWGVSGTSPVGASKASITFTFDYSLYSTAV